MGTLSTCVSMYILASNVVYAQILGNSALGFKQSIIESHRDDTNAAKIFWRIFYHGTSNDSLEGDVEGEDDKTKTMIIQLRHCVKGFAAMISAILRNYSTATEVLNGTIQSYDEILTTVHARKEIKIEGYRHLREKIGDFHNDPLPVAAHWQGEEGNSHEAKIWRLQDEYDKLVKCIRTTFKSNLTTNDFECPLTVEQSEALTSHLSTIETYARDLLAMEKLIMLGINPMIVIPLLSGRLVHAFNDSAHPPAKKVNPIDFHYDLVQVVSTDSVAQNRRLAPESAMIGRAVAFRVSQEKLPEKDAHDLILKASEVSSSFLSMSIHILGLFYYTTK